MDIIEETLCMIWDMLCEEGDQDVIVASAFFWPGSDTELNDEVCGGLLTIGGHLTMIWKASRTAIFNG